MPLAHDMAATKTGMVADRPVRVCFVLSYRAPDYIRGRALCEAIQRIPHVELRQAINSTQGVARYWQTLRRMIAIRNAWHPDVYIVGFRGHEIAWMVRRLTRGKPLLFDALISPSAALAKDRKHGFLGRMLAPLVGLLEQSVLRSADLVLTDTQSHLDYYRNEFGLDGNKLAAVPVGAVETPPAPRTNTPRDEGDASFAVLFYGSFLPLHGVDVVLDAAARLSDLPVTFHFIGGSPAQARRLRAACLKQGVRRYTHRRWVPFDRLLQEEIPRADLCLGGPFGGTWQARRVVTGKTSQFLAAGRPTVVGRIEEDFGFRDRENCLLVEQADAGALADAIRWAWLNKPALQAIGEGGRRLYQQRLSIDVIANRMQRVLRAFQPGVSVT